MITHFNIECMGNMMNQLHKAFSMQTGNESDSLIKE
jgi:hypothetical protein